MSAYRQGDLVWITRLGESAPGRYLGKICGLAMDSVVRIYIVEVRTEEPIPGQGEWTHVTVPECCLDRCLSRAQMLAGVVNDIIDKSP